MCPRQGHDEEQVPPPCHRIPDESGRVMDLVRESEWESVRESEWESGRMKKMKRWNERVAVVCCRCRDGSDPVVVCRAGVERCIRYEGIAGCALCKHAGWSILLVARMAAVSAPMRAQSTRAWSDTLCVGIHFCVDHNQRAGMGISLVSEQPSETLRERERRVPLGDELNRTRAQQEASSPGHFGVQVTKQCVQPRSRKTKWNATGERESGRAKDRKGKLRAVKRLL